VYRVIEGFPKYRVGRDGSVWSRHRGHWRRLRVFESGSGYPAVSLCRGGKQWQTNIHRLVLTAFVSQCPDGHECRHLDGNPRNNRVENLAWGTPAENAADRIRHGTTPRGENHSRAKLTDDLAREVLWLYENVTQNRSEIARRLGVGRTAIARVLNGETWSHVLAA
jgi:hypothetical protein